MNGSTFTTVSIFSTNAINSMTANAAVSTYDYATEADYNEEKGRP